MTLLSPSARDCRNAQNKKILTYGCLPVAAVVFLIAIVGSLADDNAGALTSGADSSANAPGHEQTPGEFEEQLRRELASFDFVGELV